MSHDPPLVPGVRPAHRTGAPAESGAPHRTAAPPGDDTVTARFNDLIRPYLVLKIGFALILSIVGIPLAIPWFLGLGPWWARHYFDNLKCELSASSIRFSKGILVQVEKTIPLENIQDVTFIEGPLLRRFDLSVLQFETAGQSHSGRNEMQLIGVIDAASFRSMILDRRETLKRRGVAPTATHDAQLAALTRIEQRLAEIVALLKR